MIKIRYENFISKPFNKEINLKNLSPLNLNNPVLICSWQGWPEAAESATKSVEEILSQLEVIHSVEMNSDSYYIYSDKRPTVTNIKENLRHIDWLENKFSFIKRKGSKNDVVIFEGIEPDMDWKNYVNEFIKVVEFYEIKTVIMVGALLDSVPHTREPRITFTATGKKNNSLLKKIKYSPPSYEGLLAGEPVTASFLGVLRDKNGKVILNGVYLRTRAACSAAIMRAVADGRGSPNGGAYLDMTANKKAPRSGPYFMKFLETCLPSAYRNAKQSMGKLAGKAEEPWEVRPSAHYSMGGIRSNEEGASTGGENNGSTLHGINGLFSAGQAMGGLFGANRLGSTSLTELAVFGSRAGVAASKHALLRKHKIRDKKFLLLINKVKERLGQEGNLSATSLKLILQKESWEHIGPVRTKEGLDKMDKLIKALKSKLDNIAIPSYSTWNQSFLDYIELCNMLDAASAVTVAARERNGSVGGHVRLDKKNISFLSKPYSTIVSRNSDGYWKASRVVRQRTPLKSLIYYKLLEYKRILEAKALLLMPKGVQDRTLEKKYKAIMGVSGKAPEVMPGGVEGALGESTQL